MKKSYTLLGVGLALSTLLGSCASSYRSIRPETLQYNFKETSPEDNLSISYVYDGLALRNNKKYVKRETRNAIKIVAVKIENNSATKISVGQDCRFMMGDRVLMPMEPQVAAKLIKQPVPIYLLYALLNFSVGGTQDPSGNVSGATFIPTGPFIAGGNMIVASSANANMHKELIGNNIMAKSIDPGQTAFGILCLRETTSGPLKIVLNKVAIHKE
ncbi:hypothetical protein [Rufibacter tibetensis]|uniref:Lipoprotein n=1 Tax=Rufibacter tibetensis TaxID=512763 RepID=A0A0P0CF31_9BACT|nr:hypothetical protein [Rufibacter tibetensis]ALJ00472.1 hypothetical protein DC20_17735 [Rufibacter tibetensis]